MILCTCQAGFEGLLQEEWRAQGIDALEAGPGWALFPKALPVESAFAHAQLDDVAEVSGDSVNAIAQSVASHFLEGLRGHRVESAWPCLMDGPAEIVGLGRRVSAVEKAFHEAIKRKLNRVARLAIAEQERGVGLSRGLYVFFTDFKRAFVARSWSRNGQRRMADDPSAPSRSYLKVEEAYGVLGRQPADGEGVCDLGAAPGGWSYSAAKRGARVVAVDNGPLKAGALDNPLIEHRMEDAFGVVPVRGGYDWLFCDMIEEPHRIMRAIVLPWLEAGGCRWFVVNLKFGRVNPVALLGELRHPDSPFARFAPGFRVRHLLHDREEFTVVGSVAS